MSGGDAKRLKSGTSLTEFSVAQLLQDFFRSNQPSFAVPLPSVHLMRQKWIGSASAWRQAQLLSVSDFHEACVEKGFWRSTLTTRPIATACAILLLGEQSMAQPEEIWSLLQRLSDQFEREYVNDSILSQHVALDFMWTAVSNFAVVNLIFDTYLPDLNPDSGDARPTVDRIIVLDFLRWRAHQFPLGKAGNSELPRWLKLQLRAVKQT